MNVAMLTTVHQALDVRILKEAVALREVGHTVVIVGPHPHFDEVQGVRIHPLPKWRRRVDRVLAAWRCYRAALEENSDVYQFHDPELLLIGLLLKMRGKKVVYDCHEYLALDIRNHKPWIPRWLRLPVSSLFNSLELLVARRIDGVVSVLPDMTERFRKVAPLAVTVHNYASPASLDNTVDPGLESESVVYLGLLTPNRGLHTMISAMRDLATRRPGLFCYVVGPVEGLDAYTSEELPGNMIFTGSLPHATALGYLKYASISWLPWERTDYNEVGLPNKLMEYLAAGSPVVVSDVGRIGSVVRETASGLTAIPGDPSSHADAIVEMLENTELRSECAKNGRLAFLSRFNWDNERQVLVAFYDQLVG